MKKRMITIVLSLCILVGVLPGVVSAVDSSETGQNLKKVLFEKLGNVNIADYCEADFDHDGVTEAFALVGKIMDDEMGTVPGNLYFITQMGVEIILENEGFQILESQDHMLDFPDALFYKVGKFATTGGPSFVFGVSNGKWYEAEISRCGYIWQTGPNTMQIIHSTYDGATDRTGHTWKPYYLYWDNGFHEYGGIKISISDLLKYDGGNDVYQKIINKGGTITDIIYRANDIININYTRPIGDGLESNLNATANFKDSKIVLQEGDGYGDNILERSNYGGVYATAFIPSIATYQPARAAPMESQEETPKPPEAESSIAPVLLVPEIVPQTTLDGKQIQHKDCWAAHEQERQGLIQRKQEAFAKLLVGGLTKAEEQEAKNLIAAIDLEVIRER